MSGLLGLNLWGIPLEYFLLSYVITILLVIFYKPFRDFLLCGLVGDFGIPS